MPNRHRIHRLAIFALSGVLACSASEDDAEPQNPAQDASSDAVEQPDAVQDVAPDLHADEAATEAAPDAPAEAADDAPAEDAQGDAPEDGPPCTLVKAYSSSNAACNDCAERECCAVINECFLDLECDDSYVNCILACSIDVDAGEVAPCISVCDEDYPVGKAKFEAAIGCADTHCPNECG